MRGAGDHPPPQCQRGECQRDRQVHRVEQRQVGQRIGNPFGQHGGKGGPGQCQPGQRHRRIPPIGSRVGVQRPVQAVRLPQRRGAPGPTGQCEQRGGDADEEDHPRPRCIPQPRAVDPQLQAFREHGRQQPHAARVKGGTDRRDAVPGIRVLPLQQPRVDTQRQQPACQIGQIEHVPPQPDRHQKAHPQQRQAEPRGPGGHGPVLAPGEPVSQRHRAQQRQQDKQQLLMRGKDECRVICAGRGRQLACYFSHQRQRGKAEPGEEPRLAQERLIPGIAQRERRAGVRQGLAQPPCGQQ